MTKSRGGGWTDLTDPPLRDFADLRIKEFHERWPAARSLERPASSEQIIRRGNPVGEGLLATLHLLLLDHHYIGFKLHKLSECRF